MSIELAEGFLATLTQHRGPSGASLCFDTTALGALQLDSVRASPGRITAVLPVTPAVANRYGTLHGGCIGAPAPGGSAWGAERAGGRGGARLRRAHGAGASAHLRWGPGLAHGSDMAPCTRQPSPPQPPWWTQWARRRWSQSAPRAASA